jgi:aerobic C4-dicarboxylate transport protein
VETVVIGKWTGEFDADKAERVFSGHDPFDERTMLDDDEYEPHELRVAEPEPAPVPS